MTPAQCRAARALIEWTQPQLAAAANLGLSTVVDFEKARRAVSTDAEAGIQRALEAAGVIFVDENGEGPGVRLRKQRPADEGTPLDKLNASNDG
jgi:transcriptional regulator with XRE-family HTH domain